jgi:XRE family aerobic/anaerobic benzoate catabolism transcriptional regulator
MTNATADKPADDAAYLVTLGRRVRHGRHQVGITRRQLAERSGVSERYLAQVETGSGNISVLLIRRIARVLRTDVGSLLAEPDAAGPLPDFPDTVIQPTVSADVHRRSDSGALASAGEG